MVRKPFRFCAGKLRFSVTKKGLDGAFDILCFEMLTAGAVAADCNVGRLSLIDFGRYTILGMQGPHACITIPKVYGVFS